MRNSTVKLGSSLLQAALAILAASTRESEQGGTMTSRHRNRALSLSAAALVSAALVAAGSGAAATGEFVPFVTDFPQGKSAEPFVPWVTDFGREPSPAPAQRQPLQPVAATAGLDWDDAALGAGFGFGVAALAATAALALRGRRSPITR
jgi:hypothetical protein